MLQRILGCISCSNIVAPELPIKVKTRRIITKYQPTDIFLVSDQERKAGVLEAYSCPICFLYYTKILACNQCSNYICIQCLFKIAQRAQNNIMQLKCSFCGSTKCLFKDYNQKQKRIYFDKSIPVFPRGMKCSPQTQKNTTDNEVTIELVNKDQNIANRQI